jgi:hypothetical protein
MPLNEVTPGAEAGKPRAPGLPAPESIVGEEEFTSPKGFKYRIIHTNEVDPGDTPSGKTTPSGRKGSKSRRKRS